MDIPWEKTSFIAINFTKVNKIEIGEKIQDDDVHENIDILHDLYLGLLEAAPRVPING